MKLQTMFIKLRSLDALHDRGLTWIKITFQDNVHCANSDLQRHHRFGNCWVKFTTMPIN